MWKIMQIAYVTSILLANVEKHVKAGALIHWGKKKYSDGALSSTSNLQYFLNYLSWKLLTLIYCIYKISYPVNTQNGRCWFDLSSHYQKD